jgi:hypothetical protein
MLQQGLAPRLDSERLLVVPGLSPMPSETVAGASDDNAVAAAATDTAMAEAATRAAASH